MDQFSKHFPHIWKNLIQRDKKKVNYSKGINNQWVTGSNPVIISDNIAQW